MLKGGLVSITFRKFSPKQVVELVAGAGLRQGLRGILRRGQLRGDLLVLPELPAQIGHALVHRRHPLGFFAGGLALLDL